MLASWPSRVDWTYAVVCSLRFALPTGSDAAYFRTLLAVSVLSGVVAGGDLVEPLARGFFSTELDVGSLRHLGQFVASEHGGGDRPPVFCLRRCRPLQHRLPLQRAAAVCHGVVGGSSRTLQHWVRVGLHEVLPLHGKRSHVQLRALAVLFHSGDHIIILLFSVILLGLVLIASVVGGGVT